jgi:alanyl-tRNA synthetase
VVEAGQVSLGDELELRVDGPRRQRIRANHSATHLLNLALRTVLGDHVAQKGSLVAPDKLRFDFSHGKPMTAEQLQAVEDLVNAHIRANQDSVTEVLALEAARQRGAVAMFGEKYGETVRVVRIGADSLEFCGGTHVRRAGDIGLFKVVSETGVAQGVRRIEAVTGEGAVDYLRRVEGELERAGAELRVPPFEVAARTAKLTAEMKALEREIAGLKAKLAAGGSRDLLSQASVVKLLVAQTEVDDPRALRETGDQLKDRMGSGIIVLCGVGPDKVSLLAMVSDDLTARFHAGKLVQAMVEVLGGKGGGRPDMAQGGGKDAARLPEAVARVTALVEQSGRN